MARKRAASGELNELAYASKAPVVSTGRANKRAASGEPNALLTDASKALEVVAGGARKRGASRELKHAPTKASKAPEPVDTEPGEGRGGVQVSYAPSEQISFLKRYKKVQEDLQGGGGVISALLSKTKKENSYNTQAAPTWAIRAQGISHQAYIDLSKKKKK